MTRHTPHRPKRFHTRAESQGEPSRTQVRWLRRRGFRRFAAGVAALALAATGTIATSPGTAHADAHRDGQWYLDDFSMDKVHELSQGEGVTIGVIDEGIDTEHPDLKDNIEKNIAFGEDGPTKKKPSVGEGHATAVASVLAGHGHGKNNADGILGIAPKADIISVDIFAETKEPNPSIIADAIMWLTKQGTNIIVVPGIAGAPGNSVEAFNTANNAGVAVVASAGNLTGNDADTVTGWPARAKGAIPVSGTNQNHKFWNGSTDLSNAAPQPQLGLSAPATNIPIAMPNSKYDNASGTSFSAPIVAGTLALIKSAYPNLGPRQVNERLILTADDKGPEGFDDKYGWGIVNPYKALTANVDHHEGKPTSEKNLTPLDQQGGPVDNHPPNTTQEPAVTPNPDDEAAAEAPGPPAWLTIAIIAAGALLTAALITLVITKTRRGKKNPPPPGTGPLPPGHPGQSGPTPPTGPPPPFYANPATQQPPGSTPPPQQHNPGHTPPPMAHGPATPQAPGALPPNTPQTSPQQPGQPGSAPPSNDAPWQPPHDPNTNPPNQPPQ